MESPSEIVLANHILGLEAAEPVFVGGQKAVYKATIGGQVVALKLMGLDPQGLPDENINDGSSDETIINVNVPLERARQFDHIGVASCYN